MKNKIKKLKDIPDMERYLKEDCYCPGEIYSPDGFFFQIFTINHDCEYICHRGKDCSLTNGNYDMTCVISKTNEESKPSLLLIMRGEDGKIADIIRFDATENNITLAKEIEKNNKTERKFDEFEEGATAKSLKEILSISDAIMID